MATSSKSSLALIQGVYESLLRVGEVKQPENWDKIYKSLLSLDDEELSLQATLLALKFKDPTANDTLEKMVLSNPATDQVRKQALEALVKAQGENLLSVLLECLKDAVLRLQAIQALATQNDESIVIHLLENYSKFNTLEREAFFTTMSSREKLALKLFETIDEGKLSAQHLNSFHHRQMQAFKSEELNRYLVKYWGEAQPGAKNVEREIAKYKKMLSPRFLSEADPKNGKLVYQRMCAACHKLFGEGGEIGPDLTGSGRKDTHYLLENIIDPSRIVSKHYQLATIILKDQRIITGTIVEENNQTVTVSSLNENIILEKEIIESLERSKKSMMPEGMLNSLDRNQLRDLVGYLQQ
jgi:putative heme-binding domain-containing protein